MRKGILFFLIAMAFSGAVHAKDCWLAVEGRGLETGESAENAYGASEGRGKLAQKCWNETSEDGTMHVLEGDYRNQDGTFWKLHITQSSDGPAAGRFKRLVGEGRVRLVGPRPVPYSAAAQKKGGHWIEIGRSAHHVRIENFNVSRVEYSIVANGGGNHNLHFRNLNFEDTRQNVLIYGHPQCKSQKKCRRIKDLSSDILIERVNGVRYSKRHVRLGRGISRVQVLDSHADAQAIDGDFAVGFDVENPAWDIEFRRCTARRNIFSGSEYWNGDGFKAENETRNIRWIDCAAFDNADAGFDIKTHDAVLENVIAARNSRNIRIWHTAKLKNVIAAFSKQWGGIGTESGLWTQGKARCEHCTFHNNAVQVHVENNNHSRPDVRLEDSILSLDGARTGETLRREEGSRIKFVRSEIWENGMRGKDPNWMSPRPDWEGGSEAFNSGRYGKSKGYFFGREIARP